MTKIEKTLTDTEKRRHWISVPRKYIHLFPPGGSSTIIMMQFNNGPQRRVQFDRWHRLLIGAVIFSSLGLDKPNTRVLIEKLNDGYRLTRLAVK